MTPVEITLTKVFFYGLTGAVFLSCLWQLLRNLHIAWSWQQTTGKIVNLVVDDNAEDESRIPTIEFPDEHGAIHYFEGPSSGSFLSSLGRSITVYYPPGAPESARAYGRFQRWASPLLGVIGGSCVWTIIPYCNNFNP